MRDGGNGRRPGTTSYLREINHRAVFDELRRAAQSRSQLAASVGLSKPTVASALDHLQRAGLVRRNGSAAGRAGLARNKARNRSIPFTYEPAYADPDS